MLRLRSLFTLAPLNTPGASAMAYVPWVVCSRGIGFLRLLLIARILGDAGRHEYGMYRPAQELINPLVALVMFGAADVAERYASSVERQGGGKALGTWLRRQYRQLLLAGAGAMVLMTAASPWISVAIWGERAVLLVVICGVTVVLLAFYQHMAAVLRGLRAYTAAAGMDILGSAMMLVLSAVASLMGGAVALVASYAVSLLMAMAVYAILLRRHLRAMSPECANFLVVAQGVPGETKTEVLVPMVDEPLTYAFSSGGTAKSARMTRFAAWSLVRLLLVMMFGFLSLWGVRFLAAGQLAAAASAPVSATPATAASADALRATADYAMAYTIAQLLAYFAVTLWASTYGIAARAWSHGQHRRARVQLFRVGKFGAILMTLLAVVLLLSRGIFAYLLPAGYSDAILNLLPLLLAVFIWYGLLMFAGTYADLQERPQIGAALWGCVVFIQLAGILLARFGQWNIVPREYVVLVSLIGTGVALLLVAPALLCRPFKMTATAMPLIVLAIAPLSLFCPEWVVDIIAPVILLAAVAFLYVSGLMIRPIDRRAWRRYSRRS